MNERDHGLVGHWPLASDTRDHSPIAHPTAATDIDLVESAARFNGSSSVLEVPDHPALRFGTGDFSFAVWVDAGGSETDVVGSLLDKFDPAARRGVQVYVFTNTGVASTGQPNYRHLHFGIDDGRLDAEWQDCGRPGNSVMTALAVSGGQLYAATVEYGEHEQGRLLRYRGGQEWEDLGNPVGCNAIGSVVEFEGSLYCGMGRYNFAGSAMGPTLNRTPGGQVYRYGPDGTWIDCGHPGQEDAVPESEDVPGFATGKADDAFALTVYRGGLYCVSNHRPGVFRYEGCRQWTCVGPDARVIALTIYRSRLYALLNGRRVLRHAGGTDWVDCGCPEGATQLYSAAIHYGQLYVGGWPTGAVYRWDGGRAWQPLPVGYEREIMGLALYNGKLYAGTLPMANVFRLDGDAFAYVGTLDDSHAPLRRAWSMAVYDGRLHVGTLPAGRVKCRLAGRMATWDRIFPAGWHHVAAVKAGDWLRLHVDGRLVAQSSSFDAARFDLDTDAPLRLGFGSFEHFAGRMRDVRLYSRALEPDEIAALAR